MSELRWPQVVVVLVGLCSIVLGVAIVGGRPLSLHEAVLPQSAREMFADGDWLVPKKGGEPWLESPPFPQWATVGIASLFGRCDVPGIVRLGAVLAGTSVVLMTAAMAARWYGNRIGLLSGCVLATLCEFTRYSWLAEDEIYLCVLVTLAVYLFTQVEWSPAATGHRDAIHWKLSYLFTNRSLIIWLLFAALGLTNLAKGLLFGTVLALIPMCVFLTGTFDWRRIQKYVWIWGALLALLIAIAWPLAIWKTYPDVVDVWRYDLGGRVTGEYLDINEPWWYYPVNMLWMLAPWTLLLPWTIRATWRQAYDNAISPERFLWVWALAVPFVLSIPGGKHHHYLLHALVPWAILTSQGIVLLKQEIQTWLAVWRSPWISQLTISLPTIVTIALLRTKIPGPDWLPWALCGAIPTCVGLLAWGVREPRPWRSGGLVFGVLSAAYVFGHCYAGWAIDRHRYDVEFLQAVCARATTAKIPLVVDLNDLPLGGFIKLFYLPSSARAIHNLSYLNAPEFEARPYFVVTREPKLAELSRMGETEVCLIVSSESNTNASLGKMILVRFQRNEQMARFFGPMPRISPMQAMQRADGPYLVLHQAGELHLQR